MNGFVVASGDGRPPDPTVTLEALAKGVWRAHAPGLAHAGLNALVVERDDGLLVVDSLGSPPVAAALLRALEARSSKPVRYLVFTHAHADATGGATAFAPSVLVIASESGFEAMSDPETDIGGEARARADEPASWAEPRRRVPTLTLSAPARLEDPLNPVDLIPIHSAHSPSDLVVRVESSGILAVGDLVAGDGNPWAGDADLARWIVALNNVSKMQPEIVLPLRGTPTDARGVRVQRQALTWTRYQVEQGYVDLVPPEEIPDRILRLDSLSEHFDTDAEPSFVESVVRAALETVRRERRKRGLPE
jgi:glyoxylase-like metal-dependent hydrolase (beta-lactamase superfamily II)